MNVRIFWVRAMKCMCAQTRPRFILSSEGVFGGMEFEPMLTRREKSPLPENVPRGGLNPRRCGQRAQNTTNWAIPAPLDGSKQLPALHTVECSMYWTLAWRSSGENVSLFRALPLYSCYDAPSPLTDVRSPCQFNCGAFFVNHHSLQLVSSLFTHI